MQLGLLLVERPGLKEGCKPLLAGMAMQAHHHVVEAAKGGEQTQVLKGAGDAKAGYGMARHARDRNSPPLDPAGRDRRNPGDQVEQGGFTGAIWAEQAQDFALVHPQAHVVDGH